MRTKLKPTIPNITYALIETVIHCGDKLTISKTFANANTFGYTFIGKTTKGILGIYVKRKTANDPYGLVVDIKSCFEYPNKFGRLMKFLDLVPRVKPNESYVRYTFTIEQGLKLLSYIHQVDSL